MEFFSERRFGPGKRMSFDDPSPTTWTIVKKISEHSTQLDRTDVENKKGVSYACALFLCHDDLRKENTEEAFMRIYMQVPIKGTEFDSAGDREEQAASRTHGELNAFKAFHDEKSTVTPALLGYKEGKQGEDGLVPGGYITSLVWQKVPGVQLGDGTRPAYPFWNFDDMERAKIQEAFERDYPKLLRMNWGPAFNGARHLVWDSTHQRLYFVGFRNARNLGRGDSLEKPKTLAHWGLLETRETAGTTL